MKQRVAVIDYGMGNLHSVAKAITHVAPDAEVRVTDDHALIAGADKVVFPGVGAIRDCIGELQRRGLDGVIREAIASRPVLAICVGMQALMSFSEENQGIDCLDVVPGSVRRFSAQMQDESGVDLKVPHMGWDEVRQLHAHPLWAGIEQDSRFYFVHSYYVEPADRSTVAGSCVYGLEFAAALSRDQLFAVQFHPEKSADNGLRLLKNFVEWKP